MYKTDLVLKYLKKHKTMTTLEIQQLTYTTCPHSIIRNIRNKYGADKIKDEWIEKTNIVEVDGRKLKQAIRFKKFYWLGDEATA